MDKPYDKTLVTDGPWTVSTEASGNYSSWTMYGPLGPVEQPIFGIYEAGMEGWGKLPSEHDAAFIVEARKALHETGKTPRELAAENERLRKALEFYNQPENWRMGQALDPNGGNFTGGPARAALEGK